MTNNISSIISAGSVLAFAASILATDLKAETAPDCFRLAGQIQSVSKNFSYEAWSITEKNGTLFTDPSSYHRVVRYQVIAAMYGPLFTFVEQLSDGELSEYAQLLDIAGNISNSDRAKRRLYMTMHLAVDIVGYSKTWQQYQELMVSYAGKYEEYSTKTREFCNMLTR